MVVISNYGESYPTSDESMMAYSGIGTFLRLSKSVSVLDLLALSVCASRPDASITRNSKQEQTVASYK